MQSSSVSRQSFARSVPKCELHAHLGGSIRSKTLIEFINQSGQPGGIEELESTIALLKKESNRSLSDCFQIFAVVHKCVHSCAHVTRIVREMLEDAVNENVWYLEIRSTPRPLSDFEFSPGELTTVLRVPAGCRAYGQILHPTETVDFISPVPIDASLSRYVETIIAEISNCARTVPEGGLTTTWMGRCIVRLLLSVDRSKTDRSRTENILAVASVWRNIHVPTALPGSGLVVYSSVVVGIDVSGDPTRGDLPDLLNTLSAVLEDSCTGKRRLPVSVHAGEVMNVIETQQVLRWRPERLGHMCVISHSSLSVMLQNSSSAPRIPLELCPSSNMATLHLAELIDHPLLGTWLAEDYPLSICTDDSGIFNVTLSDELELVQRTYSLSDEKIGALSLASFEAAFAGWGDDEGGKQIMSELRHCAAETIREILQG